MVPESDHFSKTQQKEMALWVSMAFTANFTPEKPRKEEGEVSCGPTADRGLAVRRDKA